MYNYLETQMDTYQRADTAIKSHTPDPPMKKLILS